MLCLSCNTICEHVGNDGPATFYQCLGCLSQFRVIHPSDCTCNPDEECPFCFNDGRYGTVSYPEFIRKSGAKYWVCPDCCRDIGFIV
jgi:hypothetical protein